MSRAATAYSQKTPASASELIAKYGALIKRVTRQVARRTGILELENELWSAAAMGLLEASRRFDASRDVKFETFAEHRIRGAVLDELRRNDHLPRRVRARAEEINKARLRLQSATGNDPTLEELAEAMGASVEELVQVEQMVQPHADIAGELEIASADATADEKLDAARVSVRLAAAIQELPERLRVLLSLYYVEDLTYREIAKVLEVSEPRVCQLHAKAMDALRARMPDVEAALR